MSFVFQCQYCWNTNDIFCYLYVLTHFVYTIYIQI